MREENKGTLDLGTPAESVRSYMRSFVDDSLRSRRTLSITFPIPLAWGKPLYPLVGLTPG